MRSKQVLRALALPLMLSSLNHLSPYRFNSDRRGNSRRISEMWLSFSFASFVSAVVYRVIVISVVWSEHSKQLFNGKCKWTEFSSGRSVPIYSLSAILIDSHTLVLFFFFFSPFVSSDQNEILSVGISRLLTPWEPLELKNQRLPLTFLDVGDLDDAPWVNFNQRVLQRWRPSP